MVSEIIGTVGAGVTPGSAQVSQASRSRIDHVTPTCLRWSITKRERVKRWALFRRMVPCYFPRISQSVHSRSVVGMNLTMLYFNGESEQHQAHRERICGQITDPSPEKQVLSEGGDRPK